MPIPSNNLLVKNLVEYGLTEKEAKIYISLLELEIATVNEVAQASGVNRSSAYVVLESLKKEGLVGISNDEKVQKYIATSPEALLYTAESRAKQQEEIKNKIGNIIPDLKALYKGTKKSPRIRVFEGKRGFIAALSETLHNKEKVVRGFSDGVNILKIAQEESVDWSIKRASLGIRFDAVYVDNKASRILMDIYPKDATPPFFRVVFVPQDEYPTPVDMMIWDDKVGYLIVDQENITTIIIESVEIGSSMKKMFELAFEQAKAKGGKYEENLKSTQ